MTHNTMQQRAGAQTMQRATANLASLFVGTLLLLAATAASAQDYRLVIALGENAGMDPGAFEDIAEESAYLAEDFGGFDVTRWYQLDSATQSGIEACGADAACYVDQMFTSTYDYVLVVSVYDEGSQYAFRFQTIDTRVGIQAAETGGYMPTPTDFPYLMAPCHDALKVTPDWIDPGPVVTLPDPELEPVAPPQPEYEVVEFTRTRHMGNLGRIGASTAGGGGALLLGGVLLGFGADETQQEIQAEPHTRSRLTALQNKGRSQQTIANVLMIAGGVAIVGGVTLVILDGARSDTPDIALGSNGSNLWVRARF